MTQLARNDDLVIGVEMLKQMYDELVRVGFTKKQAMEYIIGMSLGQYNKKNGD